MGIIRAGAFLQPNWAYGLERVDLKKLGVAIIIRKKAR
jgi:hypothetical protein